MTVLAALGAARRALSHAELVALVGAAGGDRATVFRNLRDLTLVGLARRSDRGDHTWRFALRAASVGPLAGDGAHFVCDRCGLATALPDGVVRLRPRPDLPFTLPSRSVRVRVTGTCDRCARASVGPVPRRARAGLEHGR